jgi:MFS family permease
MRLARETGETINPLPEISSSPGTDAIGQKSGRDGWLSVLANKNVRRFLIGEIASAIGSGMSPVAITFAALAAFNSASSVGYVLAAGAIPLLAFLIVGGAIGDRLGARPVMLAADVLRSVAQSSLGLWIVIGHPPLVGFILLQALVGVGTGLFMPASTALIPAITGRDSLQQANSLRHLTSSLGRFIGPAGAGVLVAAIGPGWAILADGFSYGVSVLFLWSLRGLPVVVSKSGSLLLQLQEGWHEFRSRTWLWAVVGQAGLLGISAWPVFYVLGAVVARSHLGGAAVWGLILAAMGAGTILGGLLSLRARTERPLLVIAVIPAAWLLPLLALAFDAPAFAVAASVFIVGVSGAVSMALWDTTLQKEIPPAVLSRVSSYDLTTTFALLPIGYAVVGPISVVLGLQLSFLVAATVVLGTVVALMTLPSITKTQMQLSSS